MDVELFPSFSFTTLLAQLSCETLYLDEKIVWQLVGLSSEGQSPRDVVGEDYCLRPSSSAFLRARIDQGLTIYQFPALSGTLYVFAFILIYL